MRQFLIFSFACLAALLSGAAAAEPRIAVVIGNADYEVSSWRLDNPGNDARLMAGALRSLGFDVDLVIDADRAAMDQAIRRFGRRLNAAGENAVSFVYFSGHGVQSQGFNYLLPVDANARTEQDVWDQAPRLNQFLDHMAFVGNKVNILVLDACRDNPLRSEYKNLARGGLGDIPRTPNALIAYAAAPGQTATDGAGRNSPYTRALAAALKTRASQRITSLFEDVGAEVFAATQQSQLPEFRAALVKTPGWRLTAEVPLPAEPTEPAPDGPNNAKPLRSASEWVATETTSDDCTYTRVGTRYGFSSNVGAWLAGNLALRKAPKRITMLVPLGMENDRRVAAIIASARAFATRRETQLIGPKYVTGLDDNEQKFIYCTE